MVQLFNNHYKNNFDLGGEVTVDERVFWFWAHDQQGEVTRLIENQEALGQSINVYLQLGSK